MMRKIITAAAITIAFYCNAQTLSEFGSLMQSKDTIAQEAYLKKWEKAGHNDPDYYVASFNYYVTQSKKEVVHVSNEDPKQEEALVLQDSTGNTAGFLSSRTLYSAPEANKALEIIRNGIVKFPHRLDLRFGEVYFLGELKDYETYTQRIVAVIDHSAKNKNKWLWKGAQPLDDAKNFMISSIQDYILKLYNTEDDRLLDNMLLISAAVLKHYPDNVENLSNQSIVFMLKGDYLKAIESLKKAEKANPEDCVVLANIAHAYKLQGDKANAVKYYGLMKKYGTKEDVEFANSELAKLK